jgi:DNA-binding LacI/PurR family transcriptional regulator
VGGFFDSPWNALLDSPVPIVNQDFERTAQTAVEFLMDRLQGIESQPRTVLIEADFVAQDVTDYFYNM